MAGLQDVRFDVPAQWDARWFQLFVREHLSRADARNAIGLPGVTVTGTPTTPASIGYNTDDHGQQISNRMFAAQQVVRPTIESQSLDPNAFDRPLPTPMPVNDTQAILAMEIFS